MLNQYLGLAQGLWDELLDEPAFIIAAIILLLMLAPILFAFATDGLDRAKSRKRAEKNKAKDEYVVENSQLLNQLHKLNASSSDLFDFSVKHVYIIKKHLQSPQQFRTFRPRVCAKGVLHEKRKKFDDLLIKTEHNRNAWVLYEDRAKRLLATAKAPEQLPRRLFKDKSEFAEVERRLFSQGLLNPTLSLCVRVEWSYISPKGRKQQYQHQDYAENEIIALLREEQTQAEKRDSVQRERSRMTRSLRYEVLKRDGFKCRYCGRRAEDGVQLEVDHIIPVSRGGKTEMSNLQTLCRDCNRGKSNKM